MNGKESVLLIRAGRHRDPVTGDWAEDDRQHVDVGGCIVVPRYISGGQDPTVSTYDRDRQGVVVGLTVYMPPDVQVDRTDLLEVRGETYRVEGEPFMWRSLSGRPRRLQVSLSRAEG